MCGLTYWTYGCTKTCLSLKWNALVSCDNLCLLKAYFDWELVADSCEAFVETLQISKVKDPLLIYYFSWLSCFPVSVSKEFFG
jgi:hypothetical protein